VIVKVVCLGLKEFRKVELTWPLPAKTAFKAGRQSLRLGLKILFIAK
jgi:hypothetical protein